MRRRLLRSVLALTACGMMIFGLQTSPTTSHAQPRTPCDQLGARLAEVWDREVQLRAELDMAGDGFDLVSALDRLNSILGDTEALLQRMDECSRSPVPSLAD